MISWQTLSWSQATLAILIVALVLGALYCWRATRRRPQATVVPRRSWPVVDYSARYQEKVRFLGPRFLLAKSINHRVAR